MGAQAWQVQVLFQQRPGSWSTQQEPGAYELETEGLGQPRWISSETRADSSHL